MSQTAASIAYSLLGLAALLALLRIAKGPSVLDRAVGAEVIVAIVICGLGVEAAMDRQPHALPILVSLSLLGFLGSVAVVRFVPRDVDPGRSPLQDTGEAGGPATPYSLPPDPTEIAAIDQERRS